MSAAQNKLLEVARLSMKLSGLYMQPYSHAKSPHKFTQSQLMSCLILRAYLQTTYREIIRNDDEILREPELRRHF
jgi:hypothetical protein